MAIMDAYGVLSDAQSITADGDSSAHIIDWTVADKSQGVADRQYLNITCNTTFDSANDTATLTIKLCHDTVAPIDGSSTVIYQTPEFAVDSDQLTQYNGKDKGMILCMPLPDNYDEDRILGLLFTVGGQDFTAGALDAWIGPPMHSRYDSQVAESNV